jgi:hypothetical protein
MMKKMSTFITFLSLLSLLFVPTAFAQRGMGGRGSGGWGRESQFQRIYDLNTVETITGEVVAIDNQSPINGMSLGVHLQVETETTTIPVHLGPAWYLDNQDMQVEQGDWVEVTGSRVMLAEESTIIAAEVRKGDQILTLRDQHGIPVWSGWRRQ